MKCFDRGKKRWRRNVRFRFDLTEPRYTASTINWEQRLQTTYLEQLFPKFGNEENGHWSREVERRILTGPLQMLHHVCRNDTVVWLIKGNTFLMSIQPEIPSFPFIFSLFYFFSFFFIYLLLFFFQPGPGFPASITLIHRPKWRHSSVKFFLLEVRIRIFRRQRHQRIGFTTRPVLPSQSSYFTSITIATRSDQSRWMLFRKITDEWNIHTLHWNGEH